MGRVEMSNKELDAPLHSLNNYEMYRFRPFHRSE